MNVYQVMCECVLVADTKHISISVFHRGFYFSSNRQKIFTKDLNRNRDGDNYDNSNNDKDKDHDHLNKDRLQMLLLLVYMLVVIKIQKQRQTKKEGRSITPGTIATIIITRKHQKL